MRTVLVKSAPALAVLFVLVVGFMTVNVAIQRAEAGGTDCTYLTAQCDTEKNNVDSACSDGYTQECQWAIQDAIDVCGSAANACDD